MVLNQQPRHCKIFKQSLKSTASPHPHRLTRTTGHSQATRERSRWRNLNRPVHESHALLVRRVESVRRHCIHVELVSFLRSGPL